MTIRQRIAYRKARFYDKLSDYAKWRAQDLHYYAETGRDRMADLVALHLGMKGDDNE